MDESFGLERLMELAQRAVRRHTLEATPFLTRPEQAEAELAARRAGGMLYWAAGLPDAERRRAVFAADDDVSPVEEDHVSLLKLSWSPMAPAPGHRDILGALMGLGFSRDRLGDIVVTADRKAYAAVMPELAVYVVEHLTSAGKTPVSVAEVPLFEAPVSEPGEEVTLSVSSLRLDALLTAGFRQSRTRAKEAVEGGLVYVDWQQTEHAEREVKPGQVVSWRGHGRLEISAVAPKGDRYRVTLVLRK